MRRTPWLLAALVVAAALACNPTPESERPIVIGVLSDIQSWNPYLTETQFSEDLLSLVYPSLAIEQTDYQDHPPTFAPSLAERWESSEDGLELTFHLRRDARWSDGTPVTARDVVYTWRVQTSPDVGWYASYTKDTITAVEAVDDATVVFRFNRDDPYQLMDANEGLILPSHAFSPIPPEDWTQVEWLGHVVAAGPFMPLRHVPQQEIALARNPAHWHEGQPESDQVVWRIVPDQLGLLTQLEAGELDFINRVPPDSLDRVRQDPDIQILSYRDRAYTHICWNTRHQLFSEPEVRRALSMAIDRRALIDGVFRGQADPAYGPVLSTMWAFNRELAPPTHDPEAARTALKAAGWIDRDGDGIRERGGEPFSFELLTNAESAIRRDIILMVSEQLAAVGIEAVPRTAEWGTLLTRLDAGDFDAAVNRWVEPTRIELGDVWHTPPDGVPTSNYGRYSNPEVDALLQRVAEITVLEDQKPLFDRIQQLIVADQPYAFLVENRRVAAASARLENVRPNDATPYFNLPEWRVTGAAE